MRFPIGLKIFSIAVGLLILMAAVALLSMRMTRTVDGQLVIIDQNYFPAYVALAQANIRTVEESAYVRRLLFAIAERGDNAAKLDELRQRVASTANASDDEIASARRDINRQIADPLDFDDNIALARLDDKIEALQEAHGAPSRTRARVAAADFRFLAGEELVSFYESTPGTHRGFCKVCGAPVLVKFDEHSRSAQTDPGAVALYGVALATLDDDPGVCPDAHAFIIDKAPWFAVTDDLPQYPARIPGQNAPHNS